MNKTNTKRKGLRARLSLLKWQYWWNARATRAWWLTGSRVRGEAEKRMLRDLRRSGIAICPLAELCGDEGLFPLLDSEVARLLKEQALPIDEARQRAGEKLASKSFLYELLAPRPELDPESIFGRICLAAPMLRVVNQYFGLFTQLRYLSIWLNLRTDAPPQRSQLWHRDRDDQRIIKAFVYLSDVELGSGPLVYAPGTHSRGKVRAEPESFKEEGHGNLRSEDPQMAAVVAEKEWIVGTAPKGTLVLADTTGYHRGGLAREADRLVLSFMFVSPASEFKTAIERKPGIAPSDSGDPAWSWALRLTT